MGFSSINAKSQEVKWEGQGVNIDDKKKVEASYSKWPTLDIIVAN